MPLFGFHGSGDLPIHPLDVPAINAGALWVPGLGESTAGGNLTVLSQAAQTNTLTTAGVTGDIPGIAYAGNGVRVWDWTVANYTALRVLSPGSALQATGNVSYAGWFKWTATVAGGGGVTAIPDVLRQARTFWAQWPETSTNNRAIAALSAVGAGQTPYSNLNFSHDPDGGIADDPSYVTSDKRGKFNQTNDKPVEWWTQWHFYRWEARTDGANYLGTGALNGVKLSTRIRFYVDEVLDAGTGYSAPHEQWGDPPDGPVRWHLINPRRTLYPSTAPFTLGAASNSPPGANFKGQIGWFCVANGFVAPQTWERVRRWNAPV